MTRRVYLGEGGLLISRAGYDAYPGMPEVGKAFDSSWPFAGMILGEGTFSDPAPPFVSPSDTTFNQFTSWSDPVSFALTQSIPSSYAYMILLMMEYTGTARQWTSIIPVFFQNAFTVSTPRILYRGRLSGVNHPVSTYYTRFRAPAYKFVLLGAV
jgi:hypothetical protein